MAFIDCQSQYLEIRDVRKKKEMAKTLGEVIRNHRMEARMSQEFVAEAIGVSRQSVSKWESGVSQSKRNYPKLTLTLLPIRRIKDLLEVL